MKKIIRLTESDLARIVRRVINEEHGGPNPYYSAIQYISRKLPAWTVDESMNDYGSMFICNGHKVDVSNRVITIKRPEGGTAPSSIIVEKPGFREKTYTGPFSETLYDKVVNYAKS